jgi:hypothetical protein
MKAPVILFAGATAAVLTIILVAYSLRELSLRPPEATTPPEEVTAKAPSPSAFSPSLYCEFYDISNTIVVVGFDFAVALPKSAPPRFDESYEGTQDGSQTFESNRRPSWSYAHDEDGNQMITSPDGATRIMLHGLKLNIGGVLIDEAGLRSNDYRNLDGQCRQANLVRSG